MYGSLTLTENTGILLRGMDLQSAKSNVRQYHHDAWHESDQSYT